MATLRDNDAVIVSIGRSPIGRARKGGLVDVRADELAAQTFRAILDRVPEVSTSDIEDLYLGCAEPSGEQGYNLARQISILLNADEIPGATINRFCASSIQAARMATHALWAGEGDAFLVGGVESASRFGYLDPAGNPRFALAAERTKRRMADGSSWTNPRESGELPDAYINMGQTAENVARLTGTSRTNQDEFAYRSQVLAAKSASNGFFEREIVPILRPDGTTFTADDSLRPATSLEGLAELEPAFAAGGSVTAGNACPLNDGASAALIVSGKFARERGLTPLGRVLSTAATGLSPEIMGLGPIEASKKALERAGLTISDMNIVEINEAFAAQVLPSARVLNIDLENQLNPHGGAIAIGHPFGATGVRLMGTLLNGLQARDQTFGLATLCVGGGQGMAIVLERLN